MMVRWFWDSKIQNENSRLSPCWLLRCLALPLLTALVCVPAAAQCTVYVPTHKSNSVAVIDHSVDQVIEVIPVQVQPHRRGDYPPRSLRLCNQFRVDIWVQLRLCDRLLPATPSWRRSRSEVSRLGGRSLRTEPSPM